MPTNLVYAIGDRVRIHKCSDTATNIPCQNMEGNIIGFRGFKTCNALDGTTVHVHLYTVEYCFSCYRCTETGMVKNCLYETVECCPNELELI